MTATELIYKAFGSPPIETEKYAGCCLICGKEINEGVPWKKVVKDNFTNWDEFNCIGSTHVCRECSSTLDGEISRKLRRSSFIITANAIDLFKNTDLIQKIVNPPEPPFIFCVTFSFKKHNAFHSVISYSKDNYFIRQESNIIAINRKEAIDILSHMVRLYYSGFTKEEIQYNSYHPKKIVNYGLFDFESEERILERYRGSAVFEILIRALPSALRENYLKIRKEREEKNGKRNDRIKREGGQTSLFDMETH